MKTNLRFFALLCLLASPFMQTSLTKAAVNQTAVVCLLQKFLDPKMEPTRKFSSYADALIDLLKGDAKYSKLCNTLRQIKFQRNANLIGLKLFQHKGEMPEEVQKLLKLRGQAQLIAAITRRVQ